MITIDKTYPGLIQHGDYYAYSGDITISGDCDIKINLICYGSLYCYGDLTYDGDLACYGSLYCYGDLTCDGDLACYGVLYCYGDLTCDGVKTAFYTSMFFETYRLYLTDQFIRIGCKRHTPVEWENFTDDEIEEMSDGALDWWKKYKKFVLTTHKNLCEAYKVI